jgi:hypothetical protein
MADDSALADGTIFVSAIHWGTVGHSIGIESTDFVTIMVFLEEEAFTSLSAVISTLALILAVSDSTVLADWAIDRVASAVAGSAAVGQGDLLVSWARVHEVDGFVALGLQAWVDKAAPVSLTVSARHGSNSRSVIPRSFIAW